MTRTLLTAIFLTLFSQTAFGSTKLICVYDVANWAVGYEDWELSVQSDDIIKSLGRQHMIIEVNKEKKEINFGHSIGSNDVDEIIREMPIKNFFEHSTLYHYWATDSSEIGRWEINIDRIDGSFEIGTTLTSKDEKTGKFKSESFLFYAGICQPYSEKLIQF